jgi:hypothetical protein
MASILFLGGLAPAIGMIGGGELGGDGVRTRETGTELLGGKGNNRGFGENSIGLEGTKVSLSVVIKNNNRRRGGKTQGRKIF